MDNWLKHNKNECDMLYNSILKYCNNNNCKYKVKYNGTIPLFDENFRYKFYKFCYINTHNQ